MSELWHRRKEISEGRTQYDAFCHFRDMPRGGRTVDGAYKLHRVLCRKLPQRDGVDAPGIWRRWRHQFQWNARVDALDETLEDESRRKKLAEIEAMHTRHAQMAVAFQSRLVQCIQQVDVTTLGPVAMIAWLEKATLVERRARGEATDIVKHDHTVHSQTSHLTDDELEQLEHIYAAADKRVTPIRE